MTLTWDGSLLKLFLNGNLVKSTSYTPATPSWTAASNFDLGAYEYLTVGGYNVSDDVIDEFTVTGPAINTPPPTLSITTPKGGATLSGTTPVTANGSGLTGVQFQIDGNNLGSAVTGAGPTYNSSWDTTTVTNGQHTIGAIATGAALNSSITVNVNNPLVPPVITGVSATLITSSSATINWTTDQASNSQVAYGVSNNPYSSTTPVNSSLVTLHSVNLSQLTPSTTYHYQALSQNLQGALGSSADFTFTTAAATGAQPLLVIHADAAEVSGITNGSIVTPAVGPAGFTGTVVTKGTGSVNFAPAQLGNGVYFLNCCANTNHAYYKFTGATVGNIFNVSQGQVTFSLKSRYSFAQRLANAASPRYAFDVRDGNNNHLFLFYTQATSTQLMFTYAAAGAAQYYFVPAGTEDTLFGNGDVLQVTLAWDGSLLKLSLNGNLVKSTPYTAAAASWTSASNFDLGAYEYLTVGGYNVSDDVIDEFTVIGPAITGPTLAITTPTAGANVSGNTPLAASGTGLSGVQFQIDGNNLGGVISGAGPTYNSSWDTTTVSNGQHTIGAVATGAALNSSITVNVSNTLVPPNITGVTATLITSSSATINWTTDQASNSQVAYGLSNTPYSSTTPLNGSLVTLHSVNLSQLTPSTTYHYQALSQNAQGALGSSADFIFTTAASTGSQPVLLIHADASEVSGITNGSIVTPAIAPVGFTGTVMVKGTGSMNFAPAQLGNGVYFLSCCTNTNNAYYKFTGTGVGTIFNLTQGQITFSLKSRYSFTQRLASATAPRYAFDVRDGNSTHQFLFYTRTSGTSLMFVYNVAGAAQYYFVPSGLEETLFGIGDVLQVKLTWNGSTMNLYLNGTLVKSSAYTPAAANWSAAANFDLGAYEYSTAGGYNVSEDVIDEFTVTPLP